MDKNKLLQEIRILIIVVASVTIGWFGCLEYQKYRSEKNLPKPIEENNATSLKSANVKKQTNTSVNTNLNKTAPTILYCPTITSALNYEFKWQKDSFHNNI